MSRIFISGSSTGLGLMAADLLVSKGHSVVLHARNAKRAEAVRQELTQAEATVVGDVETISGAKEVAAQVNALGHFDTVIHNAIAKAIASPLTACRMCSRSTRCRPIS